MTARTVFGPTYWRRPHACLAPGPAKPQHTLATGRQPERHADLLALDALGVGNRLLSHPYVNSRDSRPSRE
ncbi:hypothetical protein ACIPN8_10740 [Streptomyces sp. NPDC086082]|uniref:hypothetical protein n=1 Tax=Streptomyces sp. NPDC086082 TaxID=3365750 RepID=UPI003804E3C2